jgi:hypothetical protein
MIPLLGTVFQECTKFNDSDLILIDKSLAHLSHQVGVDGSHNVASPNNMHGTSSPDPSKVANISSPLAPRSSDGNDVETMKTQGMKPTNVTTKGLSTEATTVNRVGSTGVHGASSATAQDIDISIENFVPCEDASEYDEEEDTDRLIRKPRVPDVQKTCGVTIDGNPWFDKLHLI